MTFDEFCYELSRLKTKWIVDKKGVIRAADGDCAITELYEQKFGTRLIPFHWQEAVSCLGLRADVAKLVVAACDSKKKHNQLFRIRLEGVTIKRLELGC